MQVTINGEPRTLPDNLSLQQALEHLKLNAEQVAVEHNRRIVKREQWARVEVHAGDELEVVHLVGGG
ncbi:sulfur carrier protein ThiS [Acidobacteriia bacterium AH_259_A11_L15]|nr:sulfur carrier protein ThiS [Acidobacteriia bacterium AH_259_A11_L15]